MKILQSFGFLAWLMCSSPASAIDAVPEMISTLRFASDDWPPFVSASLPGDGLVGSLTRLVFKRLGYAVQVDYYPWKRSMQFGLRQPGYSGLLAVWRNTERDNVCGFSTAISSTQTVLAHLRDTPLPATNLTQLRHVRIGTVAGYANDTEFDAMVKRGELTVDEGVSDENNLKKLFLKRFPVIVIEKHVLQHLLLRENITREERQRIVVTDTLFKSRPLYVCFRRNPAGLALERQFNEALKSIDVVKFEKNYWHEIGEESILAR